ncbi:GNAT family N-acetyltransferase [Paenibacillus sp. FSL L8-0463]|uniref:GNAT family N-acetyltransferase n=1 Tax=Paenibacillus sp. FSL L8-0463 TaxID=2954687 RepID=UPI00311998F5
MIVLNKEEYGKVRHLVESQNELSVFSVLNGEMPGEVKVNSAEHPDAVLIETSETILLAGNAGDTDFNKEITGELDFWNNVTPDSAEWRDKIPAIHPNRFIREYTRYKYSLSSREFIHPELSLPEGYVMEPVNLKDLKQQNYGNADRILEWAQAWGSEERFEEGGCGCYIRKENQIVSWSLSDCSAGDVIAVGIHTDALFRKLGLAKKVVAGVVQLCFDKGYNRVEWLCVSSNAGSRAIAEGLGFKKENEYASFSSYPPIENQRDLSEEGWYDWGTYLERASKEEPKLAMDCLYCYIKANEVEKTMTFIRELTASGVEITPQRLADDISWFQKEGLCSAFNSPQWAEFTAGMLQKK